MAPFYRPPADIDDFSARPALASTLSRNWDAFIGRAIRSRAAGGLFYDAAADPTPETAPAVLPIPWNGFPRSLWQWFNADADPAGKAQALATSEVLREIDRITLSPGETLPLFERQQDEYCEWHVDRDASGGITRIVFTSEGPEYFEEMAAVDLTLVGDLYRTYVNPEVKDEDLEWPVDVLDEDENILFAKGGYNRWNDWNTRKGAMHLTHHANTLGAEINLAADATVQFPVPPTPAGTLPFRLICCARFGGVNRSSDPLIGVGVNGLARQGLSVTLDNPVGLYIQDIGIDSLRDPDGTPIGSEALQVVRASADGKRILRAHVAPPPGATYTLDQCTFEGELLTGGGQIARRITMVLFGLAKAIPDRTGTQRPCRNKCCRKPSATGFLKGVGPQVDCGSLTDAHFANDAPVTAAGPGLDIAAADARPKVPLAQLLVASRAPEGTL